MFNWEKKFRKKSCFGQNLAKKVFEKQSKALKNLKDDVKKRELKIKEMKEKVLAEKCKTKQRE